MIVEHLELVDFRNYRKERFELTDGTTVVLGNNGHGKTNLAEALAYLATLSSFRGVSNEAMIRHEAETAVIRATVLHPDGRRSNVDAELSRGAPGRVQVNRQRLRRARDLLGTIRVTVFSPDDLGIVKGSPGERRRYVDDALVALSAKYDAVRLDVDRAVRQRNRLLKQMAGRMDGDDAVTLDVWDARLADAGERFGEARAALIGRLAPIVQEAYGDLAGPTSVGLSYEPPWRTQGLAAALAVARTADVRLRASTVGPHRDDIELSIGSLPARSQASQGEQRTLALALRLGTHRLVSEQEDSAPVLVLDDVLSELDASRAAALLRHLPVGQIIITTAGAIPDAVEPHRIIRITDGAQV
ncbi:MAG: DNA replication/repair protein RecF [Acidimicrobiia bacterium]|nr:DNA replication/repair protein RecF [Acidimicrobiia bacterium]MBA3982204.1 DNA replication/repair protein RecF [Acidimicrobiia bacterium]MDQ3391345.1 DNA replication/repair protein RecF [Actinomycetota bacterium]